METWNSKKLALAGLSFAIEAGSLAGTKLLVDFSPEEIWQRLIAGSGPPSWVSRAKRLDIEKLVAESAELQIDFLTSDDPGWPTQLNDLALAQPNNCMGGVPFGIWVSGKCGLNQLAENSVAIVGARANSSYGELVAGELANDLASEYGVSIISGGAYGIDSAAHQGALNASGYTAAVMACGLDELYPKGNAKLFEQISDAGLFISELPIGVKPTKVGFLARNRLIAALSKATIVVEASQRSGARNTANWATNLSRPVLAVPGSVYSQMSWGTNQMIKDQQAQLITVASDVKTFITDLSKQLSPITQNAQRQLEKLDPKLKKVLAALTNRAAIGLDEISLKVGLPINQCASALASLDLQDLAYSSDGGATWRLKAHSSERN